MLRIIGIKKEIITVLDISHITNQFTALKTKKILLKQSNIDNTYTDPRILIVFVNIYMISFVHNKFIL